MDDKDILRALNRIENKQDTQGVAIAKIQGWMSSNGFVREKTCQALHMATKDDLEEFKDDVKDDLKALGKRQWTMWGKIAALGATMVAIGKYLLPGGGS